MSYEGGEPAANSVMMSGQPWLENLSYFTERTDNWRMRDNFYRGSVMMQNSANVANSAGIQAAGARSSCNSSRASSNASGGSRVYTGIGAKAPPAPPETEEHNNVLALPKLQTPGRSAVHPLGTGMSGMSRHSMESMLASSLGSPGGTGGSGAEWDRPLSSLPPTPPDHRRPRAITAEMGRAPVPTPYSAPKKTPRSARGKAVHERRVWPFCTAGDAMSWEDRRESKKQLGHIAKKTGLPGQWEQPEYLSYGLSLGLGLSLGKEKRHGMPAPPSGRNLTASIPVTPRRVHILSTPNYAPNAMSDEPQGGALVGPETGVASAQALAHSAVPQWQPTRQVKEMPEVMVVHHHYMPPENEYRTTAGGIGRR